MIVSPNYQASENAEHPKTVITEKGRRLQLVKLFIVALISMATVSLVVIDVFQTARSFGKKNELIYKIQGSIDTGLVIHNLQKERGMTAFLLGFEHEHLELQKIRSKTNESIEVLELRDDNELGMLTGNKNTFWKVLEDFRHEIDNGEVSVIENLHTYRKWVMQLISTLPKYTEYQNLEDYADLVYAYELVILSKEELGMERALGCLRFSNSTTKINATWYNEKRFLAENYLRTGFLFSSDMKSIHSTIFSNTSHWMKKLEEKRKIISSESFSESSDEEAHEWFDLMTKYNNLMLELQIQLADLIEAKVGDEIQESTNELVIRSLLLCFTLIIVPCIIVSLARVQKRFYQYTLSLFDKVGLEQARTDFIMQQNARLVESKYICNIRLRKTCT